MELGDVFVAQPPAPVRRDGREIRWSPLAFLDRDEKSSVFVLQDRDGKSHSVRVTPSAAAAWILDEPDENGKPIIALFAINRVEVGT